MRLITFMTAKYHTCYRLHRFTWTTDSQKLIRPPNIHVGGLIFYRDSFFLSSFFRQLPEEVAERNSTKTGHMLGSKCDLKMHVRIMGYTLPLQIGGPKTTFLTISQLNGNFNGLYLPNKTWHRQLGKCVDNYKGSPISSPNDMTLVHKQLKIGPPFLITLRKFCFLLYFHAWQTGISKRNSTKLWQTVNSKSR